MAAGCLARIAALCRVRLVASQKPTRTEDAHRQKLCCDARAPSTVLATQLADLPSVPIKERATTIAAVHRCIGLADVNAAADRLVPPLLRADGATMAVITWGRRGGGNGAVLGVAATDAVAAPPHAVRADAAPPIALPPLLAGGRRLTSGPAGAAAAAAGAHPPLRAPAGASPVAAPRALRSRWTFSWPVTVP
ncbi:hypothetical protein I4F81_010961 [Pyropia yezoensis]|uniref:Uncharacterized protein n=1 Tax=Pyropia yezoensis TaxID=2788 RepID=A0ACC3CEV4_PYRYE|nr:hypothetical protein I4F81_010961 [Neopyropia yezoensis]